MSTAAKFKELTDAVSAAGEKIAALEAKQSELAAANADQTAKLAAFTADVARVTSERDAAVAKIAQLEADAKAQAEKANADMADLTAKLTAMTQKANVAEQRLADPAFVDASAAGVSAPATDGTPANDPKANAPTWARYYAIDDAAERTKFYEANKQKLIAESRVGASK